MNKSVRLLGLDTLRASAIMLVYSYHYWFVNNNSPFGKFLTNIGWVGVDLFFVLSGYLVSNQVFQEVINSDAFVIKKFYIRRVFKTLPNYLVVLFIYFMIPGFREVNVLPPLLKLLSFTANFGLHTGVTGFSNSWSLCIEEQFYLIFPLMILILLRFSSIYKLWLIIVTGIITGIILRYWLWQHYVVITPFLDNANSKEFDQYYTWIYYFTFSRLDDLFVGIGVALTKNCHISIWNKFISKGNWWFISGLVGSCVICEIYNRNAYGLMETVFGFPLMSLSFGCLLIAALSPVSWLYRTKIPGVRIIAILSFAIYLIQKPLDQLTKNFLLQYTTVGLGSLLMPVFTIAISLAGSFALYKLIEQPFMCLRNKILYKIVI